MDEGTASDQVPETDKWTVQLEEAFGFLEVLGFRIADSGTYRLGDWTLSATATAGSISTATVTLGL